MRLAVTGNSGTAHSTASIVETLAGKTGSAEWQPGMRTHAWFTCYAPYQNPRFACLFFVSEGGHGSEAAARPAATLMRAALERYPQGCPSPLPPRITEPETDRDTEAGQ